MPQLTRPADSSRLRTDAKYAYPEVAQGATAHVSDDVLLELFYLFTVNGQLSFGGQAHVQSELVRRKLLDPDETPTWAKKRAPWGRCDSRGRSDGDCDRWTTRST